MSTTILVIDDDAEIIELVTMVLEREGFLVVRALSAQQGLRQAFMHRPNLILLDIMMPDMTGWEVCGRLRELSDVPIIFLSAKSGTNDVVKGLEMGADDYLTKPFRTAELLARVKVHLRRKPETSQIREIVFDNIPFRINFDRREVTVRNQDVELSPREFDLLAALVRNSEKVMTHEDLVTEAWGADGYQALDHLKLYILYLRRKLERNPATPEIIITARGVGYRFSPAPNVASLLMH